MSLKKKLGLGMGAAALGLSLVGGGTFAYFSDSETTNNTFAAGTLDLNVDPDIIVNVNNIKPGDKINRTFKLQNNGSLDISKVLLTTTYEVTDAQGKKNDDDFGKHIRVNFLKNEDKSGILNPNNVIVSKTLFELKSMTPDQVKNLSLFELLGKERSGLQAHTEDNLYVQFEFVDNDADQNQFQGDSISLHWKFDAQQTKGESK
ncbi:TasA family protein [Bacillus sp. MUM 13]|uniref:TasA family protein n=1 Tax=Bacillus sp. MUM 13 TaxID=1678001 RepID=UPI0008F5AEA8|nr:TasA family protein [Bacillus sp. MUM 13]OIK11411.1 cell division protein FtsN [Bacillus sp. MUM 13]